MTAETVFSRTVFRGQVLTVRVDTVKFADGKTTKREIVGYGDAVAMVAIDGAGNVLLVKQYRHAAGMELLEIPAGGIEPGERPEQAAAREMREETGFLPASIIPLGGFYSAPGYSTEFLHLFLARDLTPSPLVAEDTGDISLVKVPLSQVAGFIRDGSIRDGKSVAGLLSYLCLKPA